MLNHVNLGFTRFKTTIESYSVDQNWPTQLGLTGVNTGPNNSVPCIDFVSSGYMSLGDSNCNSRTLQTNNSFQVIDSFSVIRGIAQLEIRWRLPVDGDQRNRHLSIAWRVPIQRA